MSVQTIDPAPATMNPNTRAEPSAEMLQRNTFDQTIGDFNRDGCALIPGILSRAECEALRAGIDRAFDGPMRQDETRDYGPIVAPRMFEVDRIFRDLLVREPIISLMDKLLGPDCHMIANNAIRNAPGKAIDDFHADDFVWFPLPHDVARHDARATFPTFLVNCHFALTDLPSDEFGPLQFVPASHHSGRQPNDLKTPTFDGRGPVSLHCRAGDVYLQHPQVWHRGAPNTSNRTRYILGLVYAKRFVAQRFYPFLNYVMPADVLQGADDRLLRVLGKHGKGAYG